MSNETDTRDKVILDAISKLSSDLNEKMDKLAVNLDRLETEINHLKIGQAEIKGEVKTLDQKIDGIEAKLTEKIAGLDKRLSLVETRVTFQGNWFLGIITALGFGIIGSIFTAIFKFVG